MSALSGWHLVGVLLIIAPLWLFAVVLNRAGFSRWWALVALVPIVNVVMLWVFAFINWPAVRGR